VIRRDAGDRWLMIAQPDHALLAGELAVLWRLDFAPGMPAALGVAKHDDGWIEWEKAPRAHPETGVPIDFTETTAAEHLDIWRRGPALVARADPYAGVLVSHHGSGLTEKKLRVATSLASEERGALAGYLDEQRAFREATAGAAGIDLAAPSVARDVALLRLLDYLSLVLCCDPAETRTLEIDGLRLELTALGERAVALAPWPFGEYAEVLRPVEARAIPKRRYDDASLARALAEAERVAVDLRFARAR
jgi:hypothetical protein